MVRAYGDVNKAIKHSVLSEKYGFDLVALPDHLFHPASVKEFHSEPPWETFTLLGAISSEIKKVKLMTGVTDSVRRHPTLLAHSISTLDHLTEGGAVLGIGTGEAYNISSVKDFGFEKPYTRLKECIEIIKKLWNSSKENPVYFKGEFFELENAYMGFKPLQKPRPPIYIGGYGPKMRELTGEEADGWTPWVHVPEHYEKDLKIIRKANKSSGRSFSNFDRALFLPTVVLSDEGKAHETAIKNGKSLLVHRPNLIRSLGYPELAEKTPENWNLSYTEDEVTAQMEVMGEIPDEAVKKIVISGTPESAIDQIEEYIEAGVNHPIIFPISNFDETLKNYGQDILPYFQD